MRPISASSIEKFQHCQRRWAWNYLLDQREASGKAAEAGTRVHALLEASGDAAPEEGHYWEGYAISRMALTLHKHVPTTDQLTGHEVLFERELHGLPFKGVIDRLSDQYILDFKTTGSALTWAKTTNKLRTDVQRLIYSAAFPNVENALWITGSWKTFEVVEGALHVDPVADAPKFKLHVLTPAEEIAAVPLDTDPQSLPLPDGAGAGNTRGPCHKFGAPCPFISKCFSGSKKLTSMLDSLTASVAPAAAVVAPEPVAPSGNDGQFLIENLYVDAFPISTLPVPLVFGHEWIARASQGVAAEFGLQSALLADYGRGPALIAGELIAQLEAHCSEAGPIKYFHLETKSAEGRGVMQTLVSRARLTVKGVF